MTQVEKAIWLASGTFFVVVGIFFCRFIVQWIPSFFERLYFVGRQAVKERVKKRGRQEKYVGEFSFHYRERVVEDVRWLGITASSPQHYIQWRCCRT